MSDSLFQRLEDKLNNQRSCQHITWIWMRYFLHEKFTSEGIFCCHLKSGPRRRREREPHISSWSLFWGNINETRIWQSLSHYRPFIKISTHPPGLNKERKKLGWFWCHHLAEIWRNWMYLIWNLIVGNVKFS